MSDHPDPFQYINSGQALGQATQAAAAAGSAATAADPNAPIQSTFVAMLQAFETALVNIGVTDIGVAAGPAAGAIAGLAAPTVEADVNALIGKALAPISQEIGVLKNKLGLL